ncbi:hypothetical protein WJX73_000724 [Symbiochloris irregularis]|uniref:Anaphase-promoting complex subunit 1 N-terminal domain-containing protein n=1 Tax=Symbiochloris irregularis TaxID=706552 RepID=A0AAW1NVS9_9CHLO
MAGSGAETWSFHFGWSGLEGYGDDQITVQDNRATWNSCGLVRQVYECENTILQACWCLFDGPGQEHTRTLCLLHASSLSTFNLQGDHAVIPLPCHFLHLHPLPVGVLLSGATSGAPHTLMHALEEPRRLSVSDGRQSKPEGQWKGESVLWTSQDCPYAATVNENLGRVAVWQASQAT